MNIKMKWKRLLTGFLCMVLLACNAGSVFAEDTDIYNLTVSGNDISGNDSKGESGETETEENVTDKNGEKEPGKESDTEASEAVEELLQPLSLETDGYDISAADRTYTAGENITAYYFASEGILLLEGTGEMTGWNAQADVPWAGETINSAIVREGITAIGSYAFSYHPELGSITLPDSLKAVGSYAFCVQDSTYMTAGNLHSVGIPAGVESIGSYAFQGNKLNAIAIPDSVKVIGEYAFAGCCDAESLSIGSGLSEISSYAFQNLNRVKTLVIPDNIKTIAPGAFHNTGASEIIISDGVRMIGRSAFYLCENAEVITLGNSVETIGQMAFSQCKKLKTLVIPDSVTSIGVEAFKNCNSLSVLTLGDGLQTIGNYAFDGAYILEGIDIPDHVTQIGNGCFNNSRALKNISIGRNVVGIGNRAFFVIDTTKTNVETENKAAIEYNWANDRREVTFRSKIVFKDHAGNILKELVLEHGDTILDKVPDVGDYEDEGHTYTFTGWEPEITGDTRVTGGAEYIPQYATTAKEYVVIFKDYDGAVLKELQLPYGDTVPDKAPLPSREADGATVYMFTGWLPELAVGAVVTGEAEYTAQYSTVERKHTVTFKDYDGSILVQKEVAHGTLLSPLAPVPQREDEGLSVYTFHCWSPALQETDTLTEDITYTALYRRKTQTGIQVNYKGEMMEGDPVSTETMTVYPVYRVFDENDKLVEMIWDDKAVIGADDVRFSKDYLDRGSNEILIEQISTGLTITADIFGSYIDGIAVWQPPKELEAGTELRELDVYFTRTIEDKAGFIENNLPDLTKKVEKYELDKKDSVIIKEGDNEISVTEKESGKEYEVIIHITGIPKKTGDGGDDTKKDPEEDVSGNDPSDKKDETTSGNDPTDKKDDTTSGNDPADKKDETISGNDPADKKDETTSGNDPADKKEEKPSDGADDPGKNAGGGSDGKDKEPDVNINISVTDTDTAKPESGRHHSNPGTAEDSEPDTTGKEQDLTDLPDDGYAIRKTGKPVKTGDEAYAKLLVTAAIGLACVVLLILLCGITEAGSYIAFFTGRIFFRKNRKGFHGILTKTENPYLTVNAPENMTETVQDVIDRTGSIEECIAELKKSGAVTYLPSGTRITVFYTGKDDALETIYLKADEEKLFAILKGLPEKGKIIVQFTNEAAKLNIKLRCQK